MRIYLMRHGIAVNVGAEGVNRDADRHLSGEGKGKTAEVARGLVEIGCSPTRILTSPLVRAVQTAEIVSEILGVDFEKAPDLSMGFDVKDAIDELKTLSEDSMVVGHMPDLSDLASYLLSASCSSAFVFKKAAVCSIVFESCVRPGMGCLEWFLKPSQLRALAR